MKKKLQDMSLEELWKLFPIRLTAHRESWTDWYNEEVEKLKNKLPNDCEYYHIGSTAINGIMAKDIVDILVCIPKKYNIYDCANAINIEGYNIMNSTAERISLNYGYTEDGYAEKVFHIHMQYSGIKDEVYFRDYLNCFPEIAKEYEQLKLNLCKQYEFDRDSYTNAKSDFVKKYTDIAKLYFK